MLVTRGSELPCCHEYDVRNVGKLLQSVAIQQVAWNSFDVVCSKLCHQVGIREASDGNHTLVGPGLIASASSQASQARSHLAPGSQNKKITIKLPHCLDGV